MTQDSPTETSERALLFVMMDMPAEHDEEFNRWYAEEHLPERANLPGFRTARRFKAVAGEPPYLATYDLVLSAQRKALAGLKAGVTGKDADSIARQTFEEAGRGEEFGHSLGHGVGLNIHEAPLMGKTSDETLRAGMVVTIEPGLYRAGWGGVRIEDVVLVTDERVEVMSAARKQPVIHGA